MAEYYLGVACLNGHEVSSWADADRESHTKFCSQCGEPTISQCSECQTSIRGAMKGSLSTWKVAPHCHACGKPYAWTQRRAEALAETLNELDELNHEERERLKKSIPDIIADTPRSETAVLRFKKAAVKVGAVAGKLLMDVLSSVATAAVKKSLGL